MCLIVTKPSGVAMPSKRKLKAWFSSHPDGFGLAYLYEGRVRIVKGAMSARAMLKLVKKLRQDLNAIELEALDIIFHFRQATDGQITSQNCHPFPITDDKDALASLNVEANIALVHNGVIVEYSSYYKTEWWKEPTTPKTDTQEFIEDYLTGMGEDIWNTSVQALIKAFTGSKFALLSSKGITYIGDFIEEGGYFYSNLGYKPVAVTKTYPITVYHSKHTEAQGEDETYVTKWKKIGSSGTETKYISSDFGQRCEFCDQYVSVLYAPPNDESLVCRDCYTTLEGRAPNIDDMANY